MRVVVVNNLPLPLNRAHPPQKRLCGRRKKKTHKKTHVPSFQVCFLGLCLSVLPHSFTFEALLLQSFHKMIDLVINCQSICLPTCLSVSHSAEEMPWALGTANAEIRIPSAEHQQVSSVVSRYSDSHASFAYCPE